MTITKLELSNNSDVPEAFGSLGAGVGPRRGPDRRTKDQKEWYCLRRYLVALAAHGSLQFPLKIIKSERPDFMIDAPHGKHGIEVTEATEEGWQRELTESEAGKDDEPAGAQLIGGDGFVGELPERDWCAAVIRAINCKIDSLSRPDYPASSCDLLVYVNSRTSIVVDEARAIKVLAEATEFELDRWEACARLRRVAVLANRHILPDLISSRGTVLPLAKQ